MRIQKYFSQKKILSRRETEEYVRQGKIKVNGEIVHDLGRQIDPAKDKVEIVGNQEEKTTLLFNKPRGMATPDITSFLSDFHYLHPVGRLDKESDGLILLSNDGVVTQVVTGKEHLLEKEYVVAVKEKVTQTQMNALSKGMQLEDGPTLPTTAKIINEHTFSIFLKEGRNHQIRRMTNQVRLTVTKLTRVRIGNLSIDGLEAGEFRVLTPNEVYKLKKVD